MLIALCIMCFFAGCAYAENGYISIRNAISKSVGKGISLELKEYTSEELPEKFVVTLLFYPWKNEISLWGENDNGQEEVTIWNSEWCVPLFGGYCGSWKMINESIEEGYRFQIILQSNENGELLLIDDADKAEIMHEAMIKQAK